MQVVEQPDLDIWALVRVRAPAYTEENKLYLLSGAKAQASCTAECLLCNSKINCQASRIRNHFIKVGASGMLLPIYAHFDPHIYLFVHPDLILPKYPSDHPSNHPSIHLSTHSSIDSTIPTVPLTIRLLLHADKV